MKINHTISSKARGKCILSGEHSVLLNSTAIAIAIDKYTCCNLSAHEKGNKISIHLDNLAYHKTWGENDLIRFKSNLELSFQNYLLNKITISQVITKPEQLALYTIAFVLDKYQITIKNNLVIHITSTINMNSGMGSSAACICSIIDTFNKFYNLLLSYDELHHIGRHIENFIHGKSSGMDISLSLLGGMVTYSNNLITHQQYKNSDFIIINTGNAQNSTAECVASTIQQLKNSVLLDEMTKTTTDIIHNIQSNNNFELIRLIRRNHRQLQQLAVVPKKVNQFIAKIEQLGGACKISGAGTLQGEKAGILVLTCADTPLDIIKDFGYDIVQMPYVDNNNNSITS